MAKSGFKIVLIKPSHYDAQGYVIQWRRSTIPSNSLASVYGLLAECAEARVLGPEVEIEIDAYDECNTVIDVKSAIAGIRAAGAGFVALVGVQTNQYPRALDLARQFRAANLPVVIGGFHVSGCLSMLPEPPPELQAALDLGITLYAGEGEGRMAALLKDIAAGRLQPIYNSSRRFARHGGRHLAAAAAAHRNPGRRPLCELRCRKRLSLPMQLLHHHQCPGPQVALPHRR